MLIFSLFYALIIWVTTFFLHYKIFKIFNSIQDKEVERGVFPNGMPTFTKMYGRMLLAYLPIWIVGIIITYFSF